MSRSVAITSRSASLPRCTERWPRPCHRLSRGSTTSYVLLGVETAPGTDRARGPADGHAVDARSTAPRPINSRGSFVDCMLQPPLRWRVIVRPPAIDLDAGADRVAVAASPDQLQADPGLSPGVSLRRMAGGAVHVVDDDVDVAVVVQVAEGGAAGDVPAWRSTARRRGWRAGTAG